MSWLRTAVSTRLEQLATAQASFKMKCTNSKSGKEPNKWPCMGSGFFVIVGCFPLSTDSLYFSLYWMVWINVCVCFIVSALLFLRPSFWCKKSDIFKHTKNPVLKSNLSWLWWHIPVAQYLGDWTRRIMCLRLTSAVLQDPVSKNKNYLLLYVENTSLAISLAVLCHVKSFVLIIDISSVYCAWGGRGSKHPVFYFHVSFFNCLTFLS